MTSSTGASTAPRQRVTLQAVGRDHAIVIPPGPSGVPAWLGAGSWDFVCGRCTALLCAGVVSARAFPSLVFRCACGALNHSS
jgi:hypothetical protein